VVAAGAVGVAVFLGRGSTTTQVALGDAVSHFRATSSTDAVTTTAARAAPTSALPAPLPAPSSTAPLPTAHLPAPGVYVYATTGSDSVDALTGAHHAYPAQTTVTVTPLGCGVRVRWDAAKQRWDSWDRCLAGGGITTTAYRSYREFFGIGNENDYVCTGTALPVGAGAGTTWSMACRRGTTDTSAFSGTVVGSEPVTVAGTVVAAVHVHDDVTVSGASKGTETLDQWIDPATGLVLREKGTTDTTQGTVVGRTHYHESYELDLTSLTPRQ